MKKILIVDDEPNIVMALEYALKKNDYIVFIARDGQEAIDISLQELPALIVLDIMMPNVDGYEVLESVRSKEALKETKVIFLSAKNKKLNIQKGLDLGADAYLSKPFSMKKLLEIIDTHTKNK
jgi:DNA-binding response OmpR family regulator